MKHIWCDKTNIKDRSAHTHTRACLPRPSLTRTPGIHVNPIKTIARPHACADPDDNQTNGAHTFAHEILSGTILAARAQTPWTNANGSLLNKCNAWECQRIAHWHYVSNPTWCTMHEQIPPPPIHSMHCMHVPPPPPPHARWLDIARTHVLRTICDAHGYVETPQHYSLMTYSISVGQAWHLVDSWCENMISNWLFKMCPHVASSTSNPMSCMSTCWVSHMSKCTHYELSSRRTMSSPVMVGPKTHIQSLSSVIWHISTCRRARSRGWFAWARDTHAHSSSLCV